MLFFEIAALPHTSRPVGGRLTHYADLIFRIDNLNIRYWRSVRQVLDLVVSRNSADPLKQRIPTFADNCVAEFRTTTSTKADEITPASCPPTVTAAHALRQNRKPRKSRCHIAQFFRIIIRVSGVRVPPPLLSRFLASRRTASPKSATRKGLGVFFCGVPLLSLSHPFAADRRVLRAARLSRDPLPGCPFRSPAGPRVQVDDRPAFAAAGLPRRPLVRGTNALRCPPSM